MKIETKLLVLSKGMLEPPGREQFYWHKEIAKEATKMGVDGWWIASVVETETGLVVFFQREALKP